MRGGGLRQERLARVAAEFDNYLTFIRSEGVLILRTFEYNFGEAFLAMPCALLLVKTFNLLRSKLNLINFSLFDNTFIYLFIESQNSEIFVK